MKRTAFTLIELLVVIAIIAILAGIAIPVYNSAMERAHVADDVSQLHQIGIGIQQYLVDSDGVMFPQNPTGTPPVTWSDELQAHYVPDWRTFRSPFDRRKPAFSAGVIPVSYGLNSNLLPTDSQVNGPDYHGDSQQWVAPVDLILAGPASQGTFPVSFLGVDSMQTMIAPPNPTPKAGVYASGSMVNVVYCDAHADHLLWVDYTDNATVPNGVRRWNPLGEPLQK